MIDLSPADEQLLRLNDLNRDTQGLVFSSSDDYFLPPADFEGAPLRGSGIRLILDNPPDPVVNPPPSLTEGYYGDDVLDEFGESDLHSLLLQEPLPEEVIEEPVPPASPLPPRPPRPSEKVLRVW